MKISKQYSLLLRSNKLPTGCSFDNFNTNVSLQYESYKLLSGEEKKEIYRLTNTQTTRIQTFIRYCVATVCVTFPNIHLNETINRNDEIENYLTSNDHLMKLVMKSDPRNIEYLAKTYEINFMKQSIRGTCRQNDINYEGATSSVKRPKRRKIGTDSKHKTYASKKSKQRTEDLSDMEMLGDASDDSSILNLASTGKVEDRVIDEHLIDDDAVFSSHDSDSNHSLQGSTFEDVKELESTSSKSSSLTSSKKDPCIEWFETLRKVCLAADERGKSVNCSNKLDNHVNNLVKIIKKFMSDISYIPDFIEEVDLKKYRMDVCVEEETRGGGNNGKENNAVKINDANADLCLPNLAGQIHIDISRANVPQLPCLSYVQTSDDSIESEVSNLRTNLIMAEKKSAESEKNSQISSRRLNLARPSMK